MKRELFPLLSRATYLDTASLAPMATPVKRAMELFLQEWDGEASFGYAAWEEKLEEVRKKAASLIKAKSNEVAVLTNTSQGVNYARMLSGIKKGDVVVVSRDDFPANVLPFKAAGAELRFIPKHFTVEDVSRALKGAKLLTISHVNYATGFRADVEEIGKLCSEEGVLFHLDATQSLGMLQMDVRRVNVDFLSAGCYKWLLAPIGTAIFFSREEHLGDTPVAGWRSVENPMSFSSETFTRQASKLELGNPCFPAIYGLDAALELVLSTGLKKIERRVLSLAAKLRELLAGFEIISPESGSGIVSIKANGITKAELLEKKLFVTVRDYIRISPHFYNTTEDLERAVDILEELSSSSHNRSF